METVFEHSAGGIVLTPEGRLVIVRTRNLRGETVYGLPKGHLEDGEAALDAAAREVSEETGFQVEAVDEPPHTVSYWYVRDGVRVRKRVDFFRFTVTGGGPSLHDGEIEEVLEVEVPAGLDCLTYRSERDTARQVLSIDG